jgi:hypothetical protein
MSGMISYPTPRIGAVSAKCGITSRAKRRKLSLA